MISANGRCPNSEKIGSACLKGYRLVFTRYSSLWGGGVADVISDPESEVWGIVYDVAEKDFERLDYYEGYPTFYDRFQASINTANGVISNVWVYAVVDKGDFSPPTKNYLKIILTAVKENEFPEDYRSFLSTIKTKD